MRQRDEEGTRRIVARGLKATDNPIWLPNIGLVFTESPANRVVRLGGKTID